MAGQLTDVRLTHIQAVAEEVLARCERVLVPLTSAAEDAWCSLCARPADARISMRDDGVEMFWANTCSYHHDEPLTVTIA
jgi:hypothetical protein